MDLQGYPYVWLIVTFIVGFFAVRMGVGIWASRKVSNAADYIVAGRRLPIYMVGASVMATWFAAETLMGGPSTMVVCAGDADCTFWDATYVASFPAFFMSLLLTVVVSLATQKVDVPKPITDIDGKVIDVNLLHNLGINPVREAVGRVQPVHPGD